MCWTSFGFVILRITWVLHCERAVVLRLTGRWEINPRQAPNFLPSLAIFSIIGFDIFEDLSSFSVAKLCASSTKNKKGGIYDFSRRKVVNSLNC